MTLLLTCVLAINHPAYAMVYLVSWICLVPPLIEATGLGMAIQQSFTRHSFQITATSTAIGLVAIGFAVRAALSRYAGLALLAVTLLKVLVVDMSGAAYIYRVMSFVGVGLLFVLTSIAYARLSPRLLAQQRGADETEPPAHEEPSYETRPAD